MPEPTQLYGVTDRIKFTVIKVNNNQILTTDLRFVDAEVTVSLSAPSRCMIKIPQPEQFKSAAGIDWKTWGFWIIPEIEIGQQRKFLGAQLVSRVDVDPQSGDLTIEGTGFMGYPKGIPWLENFNPIAVDPAEVIQRIWSHLQNYVNSNLGVQVLPASTGTQMLPGYSFDGNELNFDFYAIFVREVDFQDCGDAISSLARDIPLDMYEEVTWPSTGLQKIVRLGYPYLGYKQQAISFVHGQNVVACEQADELDIEPVTDVIIRGWRPGKTYTSRLTNDDLSRARRVIMEEDASIDSTERAAAWAKRRLTRRNIPKSFKKITVDPNHPNAPIDNWWIADSIWVEAENYPWVGTIEGWHRISYITFKANEILVDVGLKVEGAFNYDPIQYDPDYEDQPTEDLNMLANGYFSKNLAGWSTRAGQWFRVTQEGYVSPGSVRVDCDDAGGESFESHKVGVNPGANYKVSVWVKRQTIVTQAGINPATEGIYIAVNPYKNGALVGIPVHVAGLPSPGGTGPWTELTGTVSIPSDGTVNEISLLLRVSKVDNGITWWDDAKVLAL